MKDENIDKFILSNFLTKQNHLNLQKILRDENIVYINYLDCRFPGLYFKSDKREILFRLRNHLEEAPRCKYCGKSLKWKVATYGEYCNKTCKSRALGKQAVETTFQKYGIKSMACLPEVQEKKRKTNLERYGSECSLSNQEVRNKAKETNLKKYGTEEPLSNELIYSKGQETKRKKHSFNSSERENELKYIFENEFGKENVLTQYKSDSYPWNCDFYIKPYNFYIEFQGFYSHGNHPFDSSSLEDISLKESIEEKAKEKSGYAPILKVWSCSDPIKRNKAKVNNLNYLEIFNFDFQKIKNEIFSIIKEKSGYQLIL